MEPHLSFQPEDLIGGQYRIIKKWIERPMGHIFIALDERSGAKVAIKIPTPGYEPHFIKKEMAVAPNLKHPHIVNTLNVGFHNGIPYIVTKLVKGKSLNTLVKDGHRLPILACAKIALPLFDVLDFLGERGVIHHDFTPGNIFFLQRTWDVMVLDFGIALVYENSEQTPDRREAIGTPGYMSPETVQGMPGKYSDHFGLGATLYRIASGVLPFDSTFLEPSKSPAQYKERQMDPNTNIAPLPHPEFNGIVMRFLSRDPIQRAITQEAREVFQRIVAENRA